MSDRTKVYIPKHYLIDTQTGYYHTIATSTTFGRKEAKIILKENLISSSHFKVLPKGDGLEVEDLESTNGTFVNGERLSKGPIIIRPGDLIRAGNFEFKYALNKPSSIEDLRPDIREKIKSARKKLIIFVILFLAVHFIMQGR